MPIIPLQARSSPASARRRRRRSSTSCTTSGTATSRTRRREHRSRRVPHTRTGERPPISPRTWIPSPLRYAETPSASRETSLEARAMRGRHAGGALAHTGNAANRPFWFLLPSVGCPLCGTGPLGRYRCTASSGATGSAPTFGSAGVERRRTATTANGGSASCPPQTPRQFPERRLPR